MATHSSMLAWGIYLHGQRNLVAKSQARLSDFHFHFSMGKRAYDMWMSPWAGLVGHPMLCLGILTRYIPARQ